jgi:hypothetical protein
MGLPLFLAASFYGRRDVRSGFEQRLWPCHAHDYAVHSGLQNQQIIQLKIGIGDC